MPGAGQIIGGTVILAVVTVLLMKSREYGGSET